MVRGETTIDLPGHGTYRLVPNYDAVVGIEATLSTGSLQLAKRFANGNAGLIEATAIVWNCGRRVDGNPNLTVDEVGVALLQLGIGPALAKVSEMIGLALGGEPEQPSAAEVAS